ncbi:MAG: TetR/AcrR family transcriptional regulator [Phycisphaerales bacterium]
MRLVAKQGPDASVRAIAKEAGLSEGALYRHYDSREALLGAVFIELIEPMIAHKEGLVAMRAPIDDRLREWVRSTYDQFDKDPNGFAFTFLTNHDLSDKYTQIAGRQSGLLKELLRQGQAEGRVRDMSIDLAAGMFVGLLLSVPERILRGILPAPAKDYTDEIAQAVWRCLGSAPGGEATPSEH